jgi:hypothetical protein
MIPVRVDALNSRLPTSRSWPAPERAGCRRVRWHRAKLYSATSRL